MWTDELISGNARRRPQAIGWTYGNRSWSWSEIDKRIDAQVNALTALGLEQGDRVAVFTENSHHLAELYFSIARAGLVAVPINPKSVRHEIEFILEDVGARVLVTSQAFVPRLGALGSLADKVEHLVGFTAEAGLPLCLEHLMVQTQDTPPHQSCHSIRAIKYTSGTTGTPKGCVSSHDQFLFNLRHYLIQVPFTADDRCLLVLPMAAGVGIYLLSTYVYVGLETLILDRFRAAEVLDAIEGHRITRFYAVPTMLRAMVDEQRRQPRDLSSLRYVGYGGQAVAASTIFEAMQAFGCGFYQTFGASEAGGFVTYLFPHDHESIRELGASQADDLGRVIMPCGRETQGFHVRIVDDNRQEVAVGEVGEIAVRSDSNMEGYWNRPAQTAEVLSDGWLYTGDVGRRDPDGMLYIVDRKRDMIVSGGLNVYSIEVENVLSLHPAVREVAIVGVADDYWGERVEAFVAATEDQATLEPALRVLCEERLASFKRPKGYTFVPEIPKTSSGKIRKVELRKMI